MYRWLKDESYTLLVTFLSRPEGTATANVAEMDGLLQVVWRTINRKYATDPEPDPEPDPAVMGTVSGGIPWLPHGWTAPAYAKGSPA